MDKISRVFGFVVGLNFTCHIYPVSQSKVLGEFKRGRWGGGLKIFARKGAR